MFEDLINLIKDCSRYFAQFSDTLSEQNIVFCLPIILER